jgi:two-component system osmolarity sensor histidine kinase EnvZ
MPRSLFGRTAAVFLALVVAFQILLFSASGYFVVWPLAKNSANDLAALMLLTAKTWSELPAERIPHYQAELRQRDQLDVAVASSAVTGQRSALPYVGLLEQALAERVRRPVSVRETSADRYAVDLPAGAQTLRFSFGRERIGTNPVLALGLVGLGSLLLGLIAALMIARGLTRPLARLAEVATRVGHGRDLAPLPEEGPAELIRLTHEFNRMTTTVRELLENRTIMLAGVSHDLRSPITRLRMGLELCRTRPSPELLARMEADLEKMDALIGGFVEFSRGIGAEPVEPIDLKEVLEELADAARMHGATVKVSTAEACVRAVAPLALHRVLANLVDNAVRYGADEPIELVLAHCAQPTVIEVRDRGPGVPADKREEVFQPFVRLDAARSHLSGGSGLGLAMVRQIAQAQGWTVELEDNRDGGTVARVTLPGG